MTGRWWVTDLKECGKKWPWFILTQTTPARFLRFRDHTQWHTTVGSTPLDEGSARRRDLYLTTHNTYNTQTSMRDSNPQSQQVSGRRLSRLRPLGHRNTLLRRLAPQNLPGCTEENSEHLSHATSCSGRHSDQERARHHQRYHARFYRQPYLRSPQNDVKKLKLTL